MMSLAAVMPGRMCRPPQVPDMHHYIAVSNLSSRIWQSAPRLAEPVIFWGTLHPGD